MVAVNSEEGGIFLHLMCQRFNLQFIGMSTFKSKYFVSEGYKADRSFYFIPRGAYLMVKTKLYCSLNYKPQYIEGGTDSNSADVCIIKNEIYRELTMKLFELCYSFDKIVYSLNVPIIFS
jgi:hypothetical protein